ncbi:bifunctional SulP family inorganic anion transporter/carbonic anhydrase [Streptosporangiaceae bacterium NEAU-GS5]|nr:bifunctional SulP family inorganic anion transporter/carbonic anhydrase [Streptosporangiaceae bacterium NEAU-GS5]
MTTLRHDVPASLVVFLIAVPLSLGVAIASGAPLAAGLVAAVVGGIVAGALGGSAVGVSGPTAGLSLIVAELVHTYGWRATCMITLLAGLAQLLFGVFRVARAALAVSPAVVHGMVAGVGVVIALSQLHIVLGGTPQRSTLDNLLELPAQLARGHGDAVLAGVVTIAVLLVWGRIPKLRAVPAPLVALLTVTGLSTALAWDVTRVDLGGGLGDLGGPAWPTGDWHAIVTAVLLVALLSAVESLLTCVASDRMHDGPRASLDRELAAQGAANVVSGALGGFPVAGVVVRTMTNVQAGARSRWSAILHGVWVLLFAVGFGWALTLIPLAALAALLVFTGVQMVNLGHARNLRGHGEVPVYVVTMAGVVLIGLAEGVLLGLGLAALLALRRLAWVSAEVRQLGERWRVLVTGSLTFIGVPRLAEALRTVPPGAPVELDLHVDFMDHAAFDALHVWRLDHEKSGGTVDIDEPHDDWYAATAQGTRVFPAKSPPRHEHHGLPWAYRRAKGLVEGARDFQRRTAPHLRPLLHRLARGQRPSHLFITCADSRVVPNLITASGPGDLFTVRNIGNLVPRHGAGDDSVAAAIEYAVKVLGVRSITVCGHSRCGAMAAMLEPVEQPGSLGGWLQHARPSLGRYEAEDPEAGLDRLCRVNVIQQLDNLRTYPLVEGLVMAGKLELTGLYFDIATAGVDVLDEEGFTPVPAVRSA